MNDFHITADRLFDGTGDAAVLRPQLRISGETIESVQTGLLPPAGCSGDRFDFPGCTILPGLIDTHVHLIFSAADTHEEVVVQVGSETDDELFARAAANARAALESGITTLRDCGGKGTIIQRLRDAIKCGKSIGPNVISCGVPITTMTGHCHWLGLIAETPDEVRRAAEKMIAENADWLKVMATGGNMTPSSDPLTPQYDDATLKMVADIGRKAGKHAAAHVLSRSALPGAVAAGYRTIEHCSWRTDDTHYEFDPELAQRIRDRELFIGLTMSGTTRRAFLPQVREATNFAPVMRLDARFECERRMLDFGLRFTLHSDAGVRWTPIDRFALGLRCAEVELKLSPAEILKAATGTAAEALDLSDRGTLAAGKRADLLIVEGNPLQDLSCLEKVRAVMKSGKWFLGPGLVN